MCTGRNGNRWDLVSTPMTQTYKILAHYWSAERSRGKFIAAENVFPAPADHEAIRIAVAWARMQEFKPHKNHGSIGYLSVCRVTVAPATEETEEVLQEDPPLFEWYDHYILDLRRFAEAVVHIAERDAQSEPARK